VPEKSLGGDERPVPGPLTAPGTTSTRTSLAEVARRPVLMAVVAVHLLFLLAPLDVLAPVDPHQIGRRLLDGELPYLDLPFEYPPLAAVPFAIAGMAPAGAGLSALALQALLLEVLVLVLVIRRHPGAAVRFGALSALSFPLLSGGFDAYVVAALAVATDLLARGDVRGWWVAAAGVPVKLASGTSWLWARTHVAVGFVSGVAAAAVALAPLLFVGASTDSWIGYSLERGVQMESVGASIAWVGQSITGEPQAYAYRFRAWELLGASGAASLALGAAVAGMVAMAVFATRRRLDPWVAAYAGVLLLLVGNKVLSPQFVTWGFPIAAVAGGRWFKLHLGITALTLAAYTRSSLDAASAVIAARNALLVLSATLSVASCVRRGRSE